MLFKLLKKDRLHQLRAERLDYESCNQGDSFNFAATNTTWYYFGLPVNYNGEERNFKGRHISGLGNVFYEN